MPNLGPAYHAKENENHIGPREYREDFAGAEEIGDGGGKEKKTFKGEGKAVRYIVHGDLELLL